MGRGNVASASSVDPNLGPTVEDYGSNRSVQAMRSDGTQTDPERSSALYCDRRKWRKWERELQSKAERLQSTVDSYKEELRKLNEDCYGNDLNVVKDYEKSAMATFLLDQVTNYKM